MRTDIRCRQCQCKLSVKVELQGKTIRCPKCQSPVKVTLSPVLLPQLGNKPGGTPMMAIPVDEEPVWAEALPDERDFDVVPDEAPVAPKPRPQSKPVRVTTPEPVEEEEEEAPRLKKKKKKKKSSANDVTSIPIWMWVLGGFGAMVVTGGLVFGIILMMRVGTPDGQSIDWKAYLIHFSIMVPITLVILIVGMFLSSALGGGINFGDAKTAIIGSLFLVLVVNFVALIPYVGIYLTLLVWLVGFMTIFGLDPWEARFLLLICWVLGLAGNWVYAHFQEKMMMKEWERMLDEEDKEDIKDRRKNRNNKKPPKEDPEDETRNYLQPDLLHGRMAAWVEAQRPVGHAVRASHGNVLVTVANVGIRDEH